MLQRKIQLAGKILAKHVRSDWIVSAEHAAIPVRRSHVLNHSKWRVTSQFSRFDPHRMANMEVERFGAKKHFDLFNSPHEDALMQKSNKSFKYSQPAYNIGPKMFRQIPASTENEKMHKRRNRALVHRGLLLLPWQRALTQHKALCFPVLPLFAWFIAMDGFARLNPIWSCCQDQLKLSTNYNFQEIQISVSIFNRSYFRYLLVTLCDY